MSGAAFASLPAGTRLGRYEVIRPIARGGMGEVYLGRLRGGSAARVVALKVLRPEFRRDESVRAMFLEEAATLLRLDHTAVVRAIELVDDADHDVLVMEFIRGRSVSELLQRWRELPATSPAVAVELVVRIARAVHYVHEATDVDGNPLGLVHRDLSPDNAMLRPDGGVKLIDFGIARATVQTSVTSAGVLKGKVSYMSPEQLRQDPLDRRSDIFSAGLILFYMLTGREAFSSDMFQALAQARNPRIPPPHEIADVPLEVSKLVAHMLAANLSHRADDAEALADQLARLRHKFYPEYTQQTFRVNVARLLVHERQQDMDFFSSLASGTKVIHAEPTPIREPTQEILSEDIQRDLAERTAELSSLELPPRGRRETTAEMDGFPQGRRDSTQEIEDALSKAMARTTQTETPGPPARRRHATPVELDMTPREPPPPSGRRNSTLELPQEGASPMRRARRTETKTIPLDRPQAALRRDEILEEETEQPVEDAFNALRDPHQKK